MTPRRDICLNAAAVPTQNSECRKTPGFLWLSEF
jgi:hypothetical protein